MNTRTRLRLTVTALVLFVLVVFFGVIGRQVLIATGDVAPNLEAFNARALAEPPLLEDFALVSRGGEPVSLENLQGQWTLVSSCTGDECTALGSRLAEVPALLPDTVVAPHLLWAGTEESGGALGDSGLPLTQVTGPEPALSGFLQVLRLQAPEARNRLALISPAGRLVAHFNPPHQPDRLARAYVKVVRWRQSHL